LKPAYIVARIEAESAMTDSTKEDLGRELFRRTAWFIVVFGIVLFVLGGSFHYWQGLLFWINFSFCTAAIGYYFYKNDQALLRRRMKAGPVAEQEPAQKRIVLSLLICVSALFIVSTLDYRFGWSYVPWPYVILGNVLLFVGYAMMFFVLKENSFAASTVQVEADQRVISTGPYALVRHPMYSGALVMFAGIPPALGSWWGLVFLVPLIGILVFRLIDEERFLVRNLSGYEDYRTKVRARLLPGIW
jgi:protein-S-isoprenylcysteine O-methyltransferase Ste14